MVRLLVTPDTFKEGSLKRTFPLDIMNASGFVKALGEFPDPVIGGPNEDLATLWPLLGKG